MRDWLLDGTGPALRTLCTAACLLIGLLLALGLSPDLAAAQDAPTGTLTGRVIDAESETPLPEATVALWRPSPDSTLVTGTVTGPEGRFRLPDVPLGGTVLRISYVGYRAREISNLRPAAGETDTDLGTVPLARTTTQQEEVEVTADRPAARFETDRNVYNTSARALSAGGSARTVLEDIPSVRVDFDGSISFRGSESVSVYVNGEPSSLQGEALLSYLESLSASAVKRIEVIPNPSAKFEPEGMSGVINIVLEHELQDTWNGGVTLGAERDAYNRYGGNGSGNVGYQSGNWRLVGTYSHRRDSEEDTDARLVEQFNGSGSSSWVDQDGSEEEVERSHSVRTDIDYTFSETTSLGLEGSVSLSRDEETGRSEYREYTGSTPTSENRTDRYVRLLDNAAADESVDGRLDFSHDFSDDHALSAQVRYDRDFENEDGTYNVCALPTQGCPQSREPRARELDVVNEDEQEGALKIDYSRPLGSFSLETGYKGTLRRLDSDQTYEIYRSGQLAEQRGTVFTFDEYIHAGYGILSRGIGDVQLEAGLRAETVQTTFDLSSQGEVTNSSYVSLYPSAFLTYKPSPKRQARLSYSKRVDRPGLWDINPIEDNENPTFREEGNPGLDPEYIHSFELGLTRRWGFGSVSVTPYLRHTVNEIEEVRRRETTDDGETVIVQRAENLSSSTAYGTELVTTFNVGDRVEGTLNGNFYRSVTDGSNLTTDLSQDALLFSGRGSVRATLRDGLQLELSQFYRPARDIPPQGRIDRFTSTELALQQELFGGDGNLTLRVDDLLNDTQMDMWYRDDDLYQKSSFQWGAREVSVSFQYTFGAGGDQDRDRGDYDRY